MAIKRLNPVARHSAESLTSKPKMIEWGDGDYVRYEDAAQLQADLDAAYAALRDVMDDVGDGLAWMQHDHAAILDKAQKAKQEG